MLNRKYMLAAAAALMAVAFVSCGGGKKVSANNLPKSGATQFITSEDDAAAFVASVSNDLQQDMSLLGATFATVDPNAITPDVEKVVLQESTKASAYFMGLMSGKGDFAKSGKLKYEFAPKFGTFKGLPAGIELAVPTSKANVKFEIGKKGKSTGEAGIDLSGYLTMDAKKLGLPETSAIKGFSFAVALKGTVKGDFTADEDFGKDGESNIEYFDYIEDGKLDADLKLTIDVGTSICSASGIGGKAVITLVGTVKGELDEKNMSNLGSLLYKIQSGRRTYASDYTDLPVEFDFKVAFYNDSNKETFSIAEKLKLEDFADLISDITNVL